MIEKDEIDAIIKSYEKDKIAIGTLGSHSALNVFKGAKEEGLRTVGICKKEDEIVYRKFPLADEVILVEDFNNLLDEDVQEMLRRLNVILVPHGSFNAYLDMDDVLNELYVPMFGNRKLFSWETDREKQRIWLQRAGLTLPEIFEDPDEIDKLAIAKFPGARGGRGYFPANSPKSFKEKAEKMIRDGHLRREACTEHIYKNTL
jgi:5-formaminoimidazole-4-carboxamide-1-(beta)-D-ribofuranosyl 5'-monophosphate synthetase